MNSDRMNEHHDENRLTTCPLCSGPLIQGTLHSRGSNFFLPDGEKLPIWYGKGFIERRNGIKLPPDPLWGGGFPACSLCRDCHMIFLPYQ